MPTNSADDKSMASSVRPPSDARLDVLDGLRGIAILMVVWWHLWLFSWLSPFFTVFGHRFDTLVIPGTGLMGVELFFFISGFVLFYPYARHLFEGRPLQTVKQFAYRRFVKIVPSYVIALIVAAVLLGEFPTFWQGVWQIVSHLLFIHIFSVPTWVGINGVLWSLGVEVQFYVIFPAVCWAFRRWPVITYLAMVAVAVGYRLWASHIDIGDYVLMGQLPAYLDLFANGMLAAYLFVWARARLPVERYQWLGTAVALGSGVAIFALLNNLLTRLYVHNGYNAWQASNRPFFGLALLVFTIAALFSYAWLHRAIANRAFVFLGVISYNLYLWHNVVMVYMLRHHLPASSMADPHADDHWKWVYIAWSLLISLAISIFITYVIERPILKKGLRAITDLFQRRPEIAREPAPAATASDG